MNCLVLRVAKQGVVMMSQDEAEGEAQLCLCVILSFVGPFSFFLGIPWLLVTNHLLPSRI